MNKILFSILIFIANVKHSMKVMYKQCKNYINNCFKPEEVEKEKMYCCLFETNSDSDNSNEIMLKLVEPIEVSSGNGYISINNVKINCDSVSIYDEEYDFPYVLQRDIEDTWSSRITDTMKLPFLSIELNGKGFTKEMKEYITLFGKFPKTKLETWIPTDYSEFELKVLTEMAEEKVFKNEDNFEV